MAAPITADRLKFEREAFAEQCRCIAGVDEAGRGPLAGPVVAAAVILPTGWITDGPPAPFDQLNDSKQLSEKKRELLFDALTQANDLLFSVAIISPLEIDRLNILRATHVAMRQALQALKRKPDLALIDGLPVRDLGFSQKAIVQGDALSLSIGAASILAKVTRDRLMLEYAKEFPGYGFEAHKGYGTPAHLAALRELGPCAIHRRSFAPVTQTELNLLG